MDVGTGVSSPMIPFAPRETPVRASLPHPSTRIKTLPPRKQPFLAPLSKCRDTDFLSGTEGPYSGGKHQFMQRENTVVRISNPHQADIGASLLVRILKQAGVSRETWEKL